MIAVIADGLGEIEQTVNAERLWRKAGRRHRDVIGVVIDFRDEIVERSRLVDRIVRGHRILRIASQRAAADSRRYGSVGSRGV